MQKLPMTKRVVLPKLSPGVLQIWVKRREKVDVEELPKQWLDGFLYHLGCVATF
ncbi:hypothetical protein M405DRAFT_824276, partial [Rhizopogon salebrosus TDB-379]